MKDKTTIALKRYIRYIKQRIRLLRLEVVNSESEQVKYFEALGKSLDEYIDSHKLYMKYLAGQINFQELTNILGEYERIAFYKELYDETKMREQKLNEFNGNLIIENQRLKDKETAEKIFQRLFEEHSAFSNNDIVVIWQVKEVLTDIAKQFGVEIKE